MAHDASQKGINTHESSAVGRLFDAAAALVLGRHMASFEGQGPMELEAIAAESCLPLSLPLAADGQGVLRSDWAPLLEMLTDAAIAPAERAGILHESLAQALLDQALAIRATTDFDALAKLVKDKKIEIEAAILVTHEEDGTVLVQQTADHRGRKGGKWGGGVAFMAAKTDDIYNRLNG